MLDKVLIGTPCRLECCLEPSERSMSEELIRVLEAIKGHKMSADEIAAQRLSFVFGNASDDDQGTKESLRRSLELAEFA